MTPEQLNAIKERAEKATLGPWYSHADGTIFLEHTKEIADVWTDNEKSDATFIAHAREDVPALVAEVERLRKELSFIAHVDLITNAYDVSHLAVNVQCWALNALDGINHDNTTAIWYEGTSK